jgi:hypothetical protein
MRLRIFDRMAIGWKLYCSQKEIPKTVSQEKEKAKAGSVVNVMRGTGIKIPRAH